MSEKESVRENSGLPDWAKHQLQKWNSMAFRNLPPTDCDRDNVSAIEKHIATLQAERDRLAEELEQYREVYNAVRFAVDIIEAGEAGSPVEAARAAQLLADSKLPALPADTNGVQE